VLDWNDLRYFLAFAREGSTLAAAKALGVNQSTVHRRLEELEQRLGRRLIDRHPSGYRLTEVGQEMRSYAERIESAVTDFERHLAACDKELIGTIRLTCPPTIGQRLLRSGLLENFHACYPSLRVELVMDDKFLDLAKGEADLAIRHGPPTDEALVARKLADVTWGVFGSRSYIQRHGQPVCPQDLDHHSVIGFDDALARHPIAQWMRTVGPNAMIAARSNSLPGVLMAVKTGAGLAPLPVPLARDESDLVLVLGSLRELTFPFYLLMHQDMRHTPRVRAFFDFAAAEIKAIRMAISGEDKSSKGALESSH